MPITAVGKAQKQPFTLAYRRLNRFKRIGWYSVLGHAAKCLQRLYLCLLVGCYVLPNYCAGSVLVKDATVSYCGIRRQAVQHVGIRNQSKLLRIITNVAEQQSGTILACVVLQQISGTRKRQLPSECLPVNRPPPGFFCHLGSLRLCPSLNEGSRYFIHRLTPLVITSIILSTHSFTTRDS